MYIVMELVDGTSLADYLSSLREKNSKVRARRLVHGRAAARSVPMCVLAPFQIDETTLWHWFLQLCLALNYCHNTKSVVHRYVYACVCVCTTARTLPL